MKKHLVNSNFKSTINFFSFGLSSQESTQGAQDQHLFLLNVLIVASIVYLQNFIWQMAANF